MKITKRKDGRYVLQKTIDGKVKSFYGADEIEVLNKYNEFTKSKTTPKTFGYYADQWETSHMEEVSTTTWKKNYKPTLEKLQPLFDIYIKDLLAPDVQAIINRYASKGVSKKTLGRIRSTVSMIIDHAIGCGERITNFTAAIKIPRQAPEKKREGLTEDEIKVVIESNEAFPIFLLFTGLRRGEVTALQWKHVDLKNKTITVCQAAEFINNQPRIKTTKTHAGNRVVPIPHILLQYLKPGKPDEYVFGGDTMWTQQKNICYWRSFNYRHGTHITQHQLRHTYASILAWSDAISPKDIQAVLGHADVRTSMQIYAHAREKEKLIPSVASALNHFVQG